MEHHRRIVSIFLSWLFLFLLCGPCSIADHLGISQQDDCEKVECPNVDPCPTDSYRLPTIVDPSLRHQLKHDQDHISTSSSDESGQLRNIQNESAQKLRRCCLSSSVEKCQCIPGLHCSPPECPHGTGPKVVLNATKEPGRCCPKFECRSVKESEVARDPSHKCNYGGFEYLSGETWSHQKDCTECFCHNGVVSCKPLRCDFYPPSGCRMARTSPQSCCPVCVGCVTSTGRVYNNSEVWDEDPCTTCTCNDGRVQCHAAMCHTTCSNPVSVPGECCPRCDNTLDREQSCPFLDCHRKECPNGFRLDRFGCPTCKCIPKSGKVPCPSGCEKQCPYGYQLDENQCPLCECREEPNNIKNINNGGNIRDRNRNLLLPPFYPEDSKENIRTLKTGTEECNQDPSSGSRIRSEGEEWADQCRRCICKNGKEMCTLITCPVPNCEHPIFFPGDCCPRCPDDEFGPQTNSKFNVSVCQSSDGSERVEGETWTLSPCLTCTCHSGQVLCSGPNCPPTPCPNSFLKNPHDCCLSCPESYQNRNKNSFGEDQQEQNSLTDTKSSNKSNFSHSNQKSTSCLSDDSAKTYNDEETWKVGACQSCICEGGRINCFSIGKCPPLECDRPVLAKNQCCPICIDHRGRIYASISGDEDKRLSDESTTTTTSARGMEPHCAILIASLLCISLVLGLLLVRQCFCRRSCSSSRLIKIKKAPPSFHSSNSSNTGHETPPVTPDCCYKCDYNKYSSCAQLSEQKPLFKPNNSCPSDSSGGNHCDKV